jgi:tetratricopeptide (TPR) repeat protein
MTTARKTKSNPTPLIVFGVIAVVVLGGVAFWLMGDVGRAKREAEAAAKIVPTIPNGKLQLVSSTMQEAHYISLDDLKRGEDGSVSVTLLKVGRKVDSIEGGGAMVSRRESIDCASRRIFEGRIGIFDVDGKLTGATNGFSGDRGRPADSGDYEIPALCDGKKSRVVQGFRVAQREVQALPDDVAARAEANPDDADAWAWLCAAGTRNRWRSQTPDDCAHALKLRPDDHATRLDRAFILMKIGRKSESDAEFARVLAADPQNATALYGRSLSHALRGDEASARKDRGAAMDIEEDVPNWVARTYDLQVSHEYRVR